MKSFRIFLFKLSSRLIIIGIILMCVSSFSGISPAEEIRELRYKTYNSKTQKVLSRFSFQITKGSMGTSNIYWVWNEDGRRIEENYVLNDQFETLWWRVINSDEDTVYIGENKGKIVSLQGRYKGKQIKKDFKVGKKPFYFNPKIGLTAFVKSGQKKGKFWGFQNKTLKAYPMAAVNKGEETVMVGGKPVEAVRVDWTVDDFRSKFFKRTYWFRKSDALYIKQRVSGEVFRELVEEFPG